VVNFVNEKIAYISVDPPEGISWEVTMDGQPLPTAEPPFAITIPGRPIGDHTLKFMKMGQTQLSHQLMCRFIWNSTILAHDLNRARAVSLSLLGLHFSEGRRR
jgi:hypothetical protein